MFVARHRGSVGADCIEKPLGHEERAALEDVLARAGVEGVSADEFRFYGSARNLYHFHVDNADAY